MRVITKFSAEPQLVVSVHVPRRDYRKFPIGDDTTFMVLDGPGLLVFKEKDCEVVDNRLDDFVFVDSATFDERVATFMWRPLAESGLWEQIVEYHPEGLRALRRMVEEAGLVWPA